MCNEPYLPLVKTQLIIREEDRAPWSQRLLQPEANIRQLFPLLEVSSGIDHGMTMS